MKTETQASTEHYDSTAPRFKGWETPRPVFDLLDKEFHFSLDVAASHENALCKNYYTPDGGFSKTVDGRHSTQMDESDGLTGSWAGTCRVFCNPPYDGSIGKWVDKAFKFEAEVAVLLLPPSVDTAWFQKIWMYYQESITDILTHDYILWDNVPGAHLTEIRFPSGRIRFNRPALKGDFILKDYELWGESIFDYSLPHVVGDSPRAGNLIAIFRR